MKFSFNRNALINEIAIAQELISTKNADSIVSYISLATDGNLLIIKAVDSQMNFQAKIPVETEEEGNAVVYCPKLMSILSLIPDGDVTFEVQSKDNLQIALIKHSVKKIRFSLKCKDTEQFPEIEKFGDVEFFDVPSKEFKEMVAHTAFATGNDETRLAMTGVYFEKDNDKLVLVATDSGRLAYEAKPLLAEVEKFNSLIVHPKILNIVAKHSSDEGTISIATTEKNIIFKFSNYILSANLIIAKFPNYKRVIPESLPSKFQVQLSEFASAIKRISVMSDQVRIFFDITPGVLSIHSTSEMGEAREEIPCQYAGENVTIAMKTKHVEDAIKVMDSDDVVFEFIASDKGVLVRPEPAASYLNIIMPMKLDV